MSYICEMVLKRPFLDDTGEDSAYCPIKLGQGSVFNKSHGWIAMHNCQVLDTTKGSWLRVKPGKDHVVQVV